ncbi:MAG TPA: carboxypeptidase-like regulatory domain-containing protein, partial [Gemmatimonadaceae bacterium]|nr:carboxypeptidase-like regulatory domain-containing protein [Gemmatimonadaceae bacterium]
MTLGALKLGAYTNAQGWFTLTGAPPGAYELRVERLGYAAVTFHWQAQAGDRTEIAITLHAVAHRLDSVVVEGRAAHNAQGKAVLAGVVTD